MSEQFKKYVPLLFFGLLLLLSFLIIRPLLESLFLGAILAFVLYPLHRKLSSKINKTASALLICFLVLFLILVPGFFIVKTLVQESSILMVTAKQKLAVGLFRGCENNFCQAIQEITNVPEVSAQVKVISEGIKNLILKRGTEFLYGVPRFMMMVFVIFFSLFYFLIGGLAFLDKLKLILGFPIPKFEFIIKRMKEITGGVVYGYFIVALIQGALGALGFYMFGLTMPLFWGVVMAFLALIPYLGTGLIWGPASVLIFLEGIFQGSNALILTGTGLFIYSFIFVGLLDNFIKPKLMANKANIPQPIIMVGILGGIMFSGIIGVILGPLILSLTIVLIDVHFGEWKKNGNKEL
ncbi:AI-2E family transporter [Candidatus Woesearchaeota archaeon]|nr:AI-2E family transporter [Candidatus Woesearchaeota archaeon]